MNECKENQANARKIFRKLPSEKERTRNPLHQPHRLRLAERKSQKKKKKLFVVTTKSDPLPRTQKEKSHEKKKKFKSEDTPEIIHREINTAVKANREEEEAEERGKSTIRKEPETPAELEPEPEKEPEKEPKKEPEQESEEAKAKAEEEKVPKIHVQRVQEDVEPNENDSNASSTSGIVHERE